MLGQVFCVSFVDETHCNASVLLGNFLIQVYIDQTFPVRHFLDYFMYSKLTL